MNAWEWLIRSSMFNEEEEGRLPHLLNGILLIIIVMGFFAETGYGIRIGFDILSTAITIAVLLLLALAYFFNRRGDFRTAILLTLGTIIPAVFFNLWLRRDEGGGINIIFYLIVPILLGEFFLSMAGYIRVALLILAGLLSFLAVDPRIIDIAIFMAIFSAIVGIAGYYRQKLEHARQDTLLSIERRRAREMELLNRITITALQRTEIHETLQVLADELGKLLEADGAFITLWDDVHQRAVPMTAYGEFRETYSTLSPQPGELTLTESVLRAGHLIAIEDVFNSPLLSPRIAAQFPARSLLGMPMIVGEEKIGAAIITFDQPHHFSEDEIALGRQAARQIALAVFKAQLYDKEARRAKQLALPEEVGRQIVDSLDEKEIIERTVKIIEDRFRYAEVAILLLVNEDTLEVVAIADTEDFGYPPGTQMKVGSGIIGHVAETRESYAAGDVSRDPYYFSSAERTGSALGVPMLDHEEPLGVIYVETTALNHFDSDDIQTLQTLANQVATAIQKARLHARTQEHLHVMTTLQSISHVVASSLELNEILENVVALLKVSFGYTYLSIYLLDGEPCAWAPKLVTRQTWSSMRYPLLQAWPGKL